MPPSPLCTFRQVRLTVSFDTAPLNKRSQCPPHPARVGAGQIGARDQRLGGECAPLVGRQRLALPFGRLAIGRGQTGARHRDLDRSERAGQRSRPATVAVARNACSSFTAGHRAAPVTWPFGRRLGRSASTISRELRRNAATRSGGLEYRATTAQWHAERSARRPEPAKLALNATLRTYVEERLAGIVVAPSGIPVTGPAVSWKNRRDGQRQIGDGPGHGARSR